MKPEDLIKEKFNEWYVMELMLRTQLFTIYVK